ncbi:MAG TPA: glycosyltransferase family 2 protein [Longimicrobiales bacterium]
MERTTVSVIIPAYNAAGHLARAIESALGQSRAPDEVLVVDDGSADATSAVAARYAPAVRVVAHGRNRGLAAARNTAARSARGALLALLDADDVWYPKKLERQLAAFAAAPDAGVVFCYAWIVFADGTRFLHCTDVPRPQDDPAGFFQALLRKNAVSGSGCSPVVRRELLLREGGWDESLRTCEDWDLWLRLARAARFVRIDEPLCEGHVRSAGLSLRRDWILADARTVLRRHLPAHVPDAAQAAALERDALARIAEYVASLEARAA